MAGATSGFFPLYFPVAARSQGFVPSRIRFRAQGLWLDEAEIAIRAAVEHANAIRDHVAENNELVFW